MLQDKLIDQKIEAILSRMSLDQKIGQMTITERNFACPEDVRDYHLGGMLSFPGSHPGDSRPADWVAMSDAYWTAAAERGDQYPSIPVLIGLDAIHGNSNVRGATVFPHNIGLGAAHEPGLVRKIARVTAREVLCAGMDWALAPSLAVARNIHWGRTYESYSEDPGLVKAYAGAFVEGMQGDLGAGGIVACAKHWVGDGGTTHGISHGETTLSEDELMKIHAAPYTDAINAGVLSIMVSLSSWNGDKCHGHKYLLSDVLKNRLRFAGVVVSDWDGIEFLSEDYHDAIALAANAGIDMFMVSENWRAAIHCLKRNVRRGAIPLERINDAVRRILGVKLACGLFDKAPPSERPLSNHVGFGGATHRALAREAVRKSLVLLKNENGLLPLNKNARVLVAGKSAHDIGHQCGGFSLTWQGKPGNEQVEGGESIWEGVRNLAPRAILSSHPEAADADPDLHDVAVIVVGEKPYAEGLGDLRSDDHVIVEAGLQIKGSLNVLEPYGKTLELARLHPEDLRTITNVTDRGIPAVVVLVSGRPLVINPELGASTAFVAAWLPGSEGRGVGDVLFGDYDFQGSLSFSWPRHPEDVSGRYKDSRPLFPIGYGLSYSKPNCSKTLEKLSA